MHQRQTAAIAAFKCLGDACPDTCCSGWSMQVDAATLARYETRAPELLEAVALQPVAADSALPRAIMQRDGKDDCVKLESGWCGIHRTKGSDFLADACHFYPRVLRRFDDTVSMTGTLSCPEVARLMLVAETDAFALEPMALERLPHSLKSYGPAGLSADAALATQALFLQSVADAESPRLSVLRLLAASQSLDGFAPEQWEETAPMVLKFADTRISAAEYQPSDVLNLLLALCGLMQAAGKSQHKYLRPLVERVLALLDCRLDWDALQLQHSDETVDFLTSLPLRAQALPWLPNFLARWLQAQLNISAFPFSGFGATLADRAAIIGVRMATLVLAILARAEQEGDAMNATHAAEEAQTLARFMDHLAEPDYSLQIYTETGWVRLGRLRGLLELLGVA